MTPGQFIGHFQPNVGQITRPPGIDKQYISRTSPREDDDHFLYTCPACRHTLLGNGDGPLWPSP